MSDYAGYVMLFMIVAWIAFRIWEGFMRPNAEPLPMRDGGNGIMEPVCPFCDARLVALQRRRHSLPVGVLAWLMLLIGIVLFLFHWLAGLAMIVVAILINLAGKSAQTVLACPACGTDVKTLD